MQGDQTHQQVWELPWLKSRTPHGGRHLHGQSHRQSVQATGRDAASTRATVPTKLQHSGPSGVLHPNSSRCNLPAFTVSTAAGRQVTSCLFLSQGSGSKVNQGQILMWEKGSKPTSFGYTFTQKSLHFMTTRLCIIQGGINVPSVPQPSRLCLWPHNIL